MRNNNPRHSNFGNVVDSKKIDKDQWKELVKNFKPYLVERKKQLTIITLLAIFGNLLGVASPYVFGQAVNVINPGMDSVAYKRLTFLVGVLSVMYLLSAISTYRQNILTNILSQSIVKSLRIDAFKKIQRLPIGYFDKNSHGNIMSILISDIENISTSLGDVISSGVVSIIVIFSTLGIMVYISPVLTLIQLVTVVVSWISLRGIAEKSKARMRERQSDLGKLSGHVEEMFTGISEVKSFTREGIAASKFDKLNSSYKENSIKAMLFAGFNYPTLNYFGSVGYAVIVIVGAMGIIKGNLSIGSLSSFIIYARVFNRPLAAIAEMYSVVQSIFVSGERYFTILNGVEEKESGNKVVEVDSLKGEIEFRDVEFSYDKDTPVIKKLSFKGDAKSTIAIVGPTGEGKTTLVNLLMRFYDIDSGEILLDGTNIKEYSLESVRKLFGMVLQDTWLFTGSIAENIAYGTEGATREDVIAAAKEACVHDFILKLPRGYDSVINEEKINISEGERQLITIARIILANPKFLILDEATSGIDTRTEIKLQEAMREMMKDRTSFIIAHRLSTIRNADKILVIKGGKIEEEGTHEVLMEKKGFYYTLFNKQYEN